jgi:Copper type II ascorbate-dependent monooxygenase, C-terminal domain
MWKTWSVIAAALAVLVGTLVFGVSTAQASAPTVTRIVLQAPKAYKPMAPPGATDDYHCTLLNPHLTHNAFITSVDFQANSPEVHHEITYEVPPDLAAQAEAQNDGGKGWTCFGEAGLAGSAADSLNGGTPWLTAWGPGHNVSKEPAGTGAPMPKGSLVIVQEHYNLLVGDKPVRSKLTISTVPATTPLRPLRLELAAAPPDVPCPADTSGPMCSRSAELASVGQRFGADQKALVGALETFCGRNPADPPVGDTTSCVWPIRGKGNIVELAAHMHLLGVSMKFVLDPNTPKQRTLLDVPNYDFHYQRGYVLSKAVPVGPGDTIGITCTYDPTREVELPILRKVSPHFVTWGDGSTDEMCLGLIEMTPPNAETESTALAHAFSPSV